MKNKNRFSRTILAVCFFEAIGKTVVCYGMLSFRRTAILTVVVVTPLFERTAQNNSYGLCSLFGAGGGRKKSTEQGCQAVDVLTGILFFLRIVDSLFFPKPLIRWVVVTSHSNFFSK